MNINEVLELTNINKKVPLFSVVLNTYIKHELKCKIIILLIISTFSSY